MPVHTFDPVVITFQTTELFQSGITQPGLEFVTFAFRPSDNFIVAVYKPVAQP